MAIYFNNKILEPKENGNSLERKYFEDLKELKKLFDTFRKKGEAVSTLIFTRDFEKVWNAKKTSYKPAPPIALPLSANIYLPDLGSVQIRYSKEPPIITDKKVMWRVGSEMISDIRSVTENEMDFAWFILKATNYVKKGLIKLENKKVEFDKDFDRLKVQAKPYAMLFSDERTEEELLNVVSDIFPSNKIHYENGVSELALKIWDEVVRGDKTGQPWGYTELERSLQKEIDKKKAFKDRSVRLAKQDEDDEDAVQVEMLKAPVGRKKSDLLDEALKMGLPVTPEMKSSLIYSMIQANKKA